MGGDIRVPVARMLDDAALVAEIDVDKAKALCVSLSPFEVIENAPRVIAADSRTILIARRSSTRWSR